MTTWRKRKKEEEEIIEYEGFGPEDKRRQQN